MKHTSRQGGVHPLLIVLVVLVVAAAGFLAWSMLGRNQRNDTPTNGQETSRQQDDENRENEEDEPTGQTESWLVYSPPGYTIRLADGWELMKKQGNEDSLVALSNDNLRPQPGVLAVVREYNPSAPGEFTYGLVLDYLEPRQGSCTEFYDFSDRAFTTEGGYPAYKKVESGSALRLSAGDQRYSYCVEKGTSAMIITYTLSSEAENYSETVEKVVRTIQ